MKRADADRKVSFSFDKETMCEEKKRKRKEKDTRTTKKKVFFRKRDDV